MTGLIVRTLSDQLVDVMRQRILTGAAAADEPIRQDALASELGVSKIPLREALTRLEQEGLVRSHANRGYFVRGLDAAEAEEVYSLRLMLEPDTAARAAALADERQREVASAALKALASHSGERRTALVTLNRDYHMALVRPSGRPISVRLLERLHVLSDRYVYKHLELLGRDERAASEHAQLLQLWLDRDAAGVVSALRQHIENTLFDLRRQLTAEQTALAQSSQPAA
jgi:DNA-binding GntR family transcriptional regulator